MIKKITLLGSIAFFTLLFIYCTTDDSTILGPFGNAGKYITVKNFSVDKTLVYSKGDTAFVSIKVLDVDNAPATGLIVDFSAQFGSITESDTIDSSGIALATFISDDNIGENIITADTGVKKYELYLHVVHYQPKYVELFSASPVLLADGISTTVITAVYIDSVGNPMPGETVTFTTTLGEIRPEIVITDSLGVASAVLTSEKTEGTATVTAISSITKSIDIKFHKYFPSYIELYSALSSIWADGDSFTTITAVVKDSVGNPMPGMTVDFTTTLGGLYPEVAITNDLGVATTTLTSVTTEGTAVVTATSYISNSVEVKFNNYTPNIIEMSASQTTILADGLSTTTITVIAKGNDGILMPGIDLLFSTTQGVLSDSTKRTDQGGSTEIILTSTGSVTNVIATIKAVLYDDTSISEDINIQLRGITSITNIDSVKMSDEGIYNAYIRANLFETLTGDPINNGTVRFSSTVGIMNDPLVAIKNGGVAHSVFSTEVLPANQNNIIITSQLSSAPILTDTVEFDIPGVEMLINTIDDEVMGDGEGWALVKATLRETTGKAIANTKIEWETTLGTIIGQSKTNSSGHTIDTLRIESSVSSDTDVTIRANYGDNVSISDVVTFVEPENSNRLILGFEPDISSDSSFVACDVEIEFAIRDVGISAMFVDSNGRGIDWQQIYFSVVPHNFARICERAYTSQGIATVMLAYPPQNGGEIVRVWAESESDGTRGSIDVVLPVVGEE